jgi:hypothetical protein
MPNDDNQNDYITLHPAPGVFPVTELLETDLWKAIGPLARQVLPVLWDYHRKYPDACHPSRATLSSMAGLSPPSVTKAISMLESMGLVEVSRHPGLRANTYRLDWTQVRKPEARSEVKGSPFGRPSRGRGMILTTDETGVERPSFYSKRPGYRMSDECLCRSGWEVNMHEWLVAWSVPHWCQVPYHLLDAELWYPKRNTRDTTSTVDFVIAPFHAVEVRDTRGNQRTATRYLEKLDRKVRALEAAGWTVHVVDAATWPSDEEFCDLLCTAWEEATIRETARLYSLLEPFNGPVGHNQRQLRRLRELARDAKAREDREAPPRGATRLYEYVRSESGAPSVCRREPALVLMAAAGKAPTSSSNLRTTADRIEELQQELENLRPEDAYRSELEAMLDELTAESDGTSPAGSSACSEMRDDLTDIEPEDTSDADNGYSAVPDESSYGGQGDAQSSGQFDGGNKVDLLALLTGHGQPPSGGVEPA